MSLPAVFQHLQVLEGAALIRSRKAGRVRTCQIEPATLRLAEDWIAQRRTTWEHRLDRLGEVLSQPDAPVTAGESDQAHDAGGMP